MCSTPRATIPLLVGVVERREMNKNIIIAFTILTPFVTVGIFRELRLATPKKSLIPKPVDIPLSEAPTPREDTEESYDPWAHRSERKFVSDLGSFANLVKSAAGTGLFAIPNAFACVGMLLGIVGTIVMGILITVSLQLLMRTHYLMCKRDKSPTLNYDRLVSVTLTSGVLKGRISPECITLIIDVAMLACYLGIGAVYVVFVSGIVQECIDMEKTINQAFYSLIIFPLFLLMNLIKGLNNFAPISMIANGLLVVSAIVGTIYAVKEGNGKWVLIEKNVSSYPKFIGTAFFSMCSPGLVLAIDHSMKNPWNYTKFCGVLNWGMGFLIGLHVIVGSVVYAQWGSDSLANFIRNHPEHHAGTFSVLVMQGVAIYLSYGLQCYMPISILYDDYAVPSLQDGACKGSRYFWNLLVRFGVTAITCTLAAAIPQLHLFTSLVGALCVATLGTIIPAILYIVSQYGSFGRFGWRLIVALVVLCIGFFAMACGTLSSAILIIRYLEYG
ncbi:proton-coupled amino acid transporter-like protein CG1139 [Venturia canescens]|uniref:proton-coupled amino acid transporter-like protein CG1139 n=1 Tax=Venturia canescens TaxID=32260 RepID=UPI001C9BCEDD|nr:proton-coupled amino acid transporter-like protein CG1139 [Venturia canescens]